MRGETPLRAAFYIDGFNLYNGLFRDQPPLPARYKWLDLSAMCRRLATPEDALIVKYFTARVSNTERDPTQRNRQEVYWRALRTCVDPDVQLIEGKFLKVQKSGIVKRIIHGTGTVGALVRIETFEEKGSDVNVAIELVTDGLLDRFDLAYVISNDSDLCGAIEKVRSVTGKAVFVVNPTSRKSYQLERVATRYRDLDREVVRQSELPDVVTTTKGIITRPTVWK